MINTTLTNVLKDLLQETVNQFLLKVEPNNTFEPFIFKHLLPVVFIHNYYVSFILILYVLFDSIYSVIHFFTIYLY